MTWRVRLSAAAQADFSYIVDWTVERFGARQAEVYAGVIAAALRDLSAGPSQIGVKARDDIGKGVFALHVARGGRKGRHFVVFRSDDAGRIIEVVRILRDAMDLRRHLPPAG
ncbi:MAG: type II toxin-antitoxin system RelE/ParE family toxin [Gammaproteobacteria bacterium]